MASYTNVPDSVLEPGDPIRSVDIIAIKDNIEHYAENNGTTTVFNSPGTWTKPATVKRIKVTVIGGGGAATFSPIAGAPTNIGSPGGTSSFGAFLSATGGVGVSRNTPDLGQGGSGSGGDLNASGGPGLKNPAISAVAGGQAAFGFSSTVQGTAARQNGILYGGGANASEAAARSAGGGGGSIRWIPAPSIPGPVTVTRGAGGTATGPAAPTSGANGADGVVIVEEFY
jgi:hypothetical protein